MPLLSLSLSPPDTRGLAGSSSASVLLAYPSMDTSLSGSLTPVERFGFLSSYLTITRTWGQADSLATGGRSSSLSSLLSFSLLRAIKISDETKGGTVEGRRKSFPAGNLSNATRVPPKSLEIRGRKIRGARLLINGSSAVSIAERYRAARS